MRCAQAAQAKGFLCFGVQFYGECWGSVTACETYNSYGKSMRCTGGVGVYWANFVYKGRCGSGKYIHLIISTRTSAALRYVNNLWMMLNIIRLCSVISGSLISP